MSPKGDSPLDLNLMEHKAQGRKEVAEACITAALTALAVELIRWGVEEAKSYKKRHEEAKVAKEEEAEDN